jgi:hypothetical protein
MIKGSCISQKGVCLCVMSTRSLSYSLSSDPLEQERLARIGQDVKALPKAQNMSQTDIGQRVGLSSDSLAFS